MPYCTLARLKEYLVNFIPDNTETTLTDDLLENRLEDEAQEIFNDWDYGKENIPTSPSDPATWLDLLLELLNLESVLVKIFADRAALKADSFRRQQELYKKVAGFRKKEFCLGDFTPAIVYYLDGNLIETQPFFTDSELDLRLLAKDVSGLKITEKSKPNIETALRIVARESAYVRGKSIAEGFETAITNLTPRQLRKYREITLNLVSPQIARISLEGEYSSLVDEQINMSIETALNTEFYDYYNIFLL